MYTPPSVFLHSHACRNLYFQESVAIYALQSPSSQNVTVVLDILGALANSLGSRRLEAVNNIMLSLLLELEKQKNMHLFSEPTGRVRVCVIPFIYRTVFFVCMPSHIKFLLS